MLNLLSSPYSLFAIQGFSKAIIAGKRSGKLVYVIIMIYDILKEIWGGSLNTEPISTGVDSSSVNDREKTALSQQDEMNINDDTNDDLGEYFYNKNECHIGCNSISIIIARLKQLAIFFLYSCWYSSQSYFC